MLIRASLQEHPSLKHSSPTRGQILLIENDPCCCPPGRRTQNRMIPVETVWTKRVEARLHPLSVPPLWHSGVTGKIKGETRGGGGGGVVAMQLGSLLPCLAQREIKAACSYVCLSGQPFTERVHTNQDGRHRSKCGFKQIVWLPEVPSISQVTALTLVFIYAQG